MYNPRQRPAYQPNYGYNMNSQPYYPYPPSNQNSNLPAYYQNPNNYANINYRSNNNNNNANIQNFQSLKLEEALEKSSYPPYKKEFIERFITNNYFQNKEAKVYFQPSEKTFVIIYKLNIYLNTKSYKVTLIVHIPILYPDYPPEIYIEKKPYIGINKVYLDGRINENDFKIDMDRFGKFDPEKNNLPEIINNIKYAFNQTFPVYNNKSQANQREIFDKNNINLKQVNEIIIESNNFTDEQFLNFLKNQTKDILRAQYDEYMIKFKIDQNYKELNNINYKVKMKSGNGSNDPNNNPMSGEIDTLHNIKNQFNQIENSLRNELNDMQSEINAFEKANELIKVNDEKDLEYAVMKKTIEDYLVYLKKGYEKKLVNFDDMVNKTRMLSRELFSIDYLRNQRKKK